MIPSVEETVSCDSHVLIWALPWAMPPGRREKKKGQDVQQMRRRAAILLNLLEEKKCTLCIPTIVLSELLAPVPVAKHGGILANFDSQFFCASFDIRACSLAVQLWQFERGIAEQGGGLPEAERTERRILKADILIVATARISGATRFYSHEEKCRRLAQQAGMLAHDLPQTSGNFLTDMAVEEDQEKEGN